jgi:hypothetical protein
LHQDSELQLYLLKINFNHHDSSLTDDEWWIAQECFGELDAAFDDDPQGMVEAVAAIALGFGAKAWARILAGADRVVVARLLGMMAIVCPGCLREGVVGVI